MLVLADQGLDCDSQDLIEIVCFITWVLIYMYLCSEEAAEKMKNHTIICMCMLMFALFTHLKYVSMFSKYNNHKLQTNPWHCKE